MWPDFAINWTLGKFLKPLATINLPNLLPFLGNSCKGVNIYHFSSEIIFGQILQTFGDFYLVTLLLMHFTSVCTVIIFISFLLLLFLQISPFLKLHLFIQFFHSFETFSLSLYMFQYLYRIFLYLSISVSQILALKR